MVRTRFAPSPTGYLHIGGVRTALFCWLFARGQGGEFILRIDDTDQQRNVESALAPILHGLKWLGIDWDEGPDIGGPYGPYYQSQRQDNYRAAAARLLASGHAYLDYATPEEIAAEREAAQKEKRPFLYSRKYMAATPEQQAEFAGQGRSAVVRLKMPREGKLVLDDLIRGRVEFDWALEQDHVIQRADGSCLYHLASVVDDNDFEITHVIRAEEHLSNTPRQIFILQALGYPLPVYAHLPFVAEPGSKNKLSKRKLDTYLKNRDFAQVNEHGQAIAQALGLEVAKETFNPVVVDFYEQVGYLPDAIINYLALLGWSLDDQREFFTRDELIQSFSLDRVGKAGASFDPKKLWSFEDHYMRELEPTKKLELMLPYLQRAGLIADPAPAADLDKLAQIIAASGDRLKVAGDILAYADFFFAPELTYDQDAFEKRLRKPGAADLLARYRETLAALATWDVATLEQATHEFLNAAGIKIGDIIHAIRVATTGKAVGPGLYDCLAILGREETLRRIDQSLAAI
ncbi:MAG: glutamate--tRNA ligase [Planctomycetaceae bacterium]|nr:glutamate--tRNA ligase [Planctomycetaceae bacterium]